MDILKEFLESSSITGLAHISSARVSSMYICVLFIVSFSDKALEDSMVLSCMPWFRWGWNPDCQVL